MNIIERPHYLSKIEHNFGRNTIIILTGQRRVGKSYLLRNLRKNLQCQPGNNVIFIDKEKKEFDSINSYIQLNEYIDRNRKIGVKNFVLIDEIQDIENFEKSLRAFYEEEDIELIVTGSNSKILSGELSTKIAGRFKEIYIQSLNYEEFLKFHHLIDSDESLSKFLRYGGLPGLIRTGLNEDDVLEYQNDVINTVLLKDIILRHQIRNVPFLQNLIHFLADNTGKLISASNIAKYMKSNDNPLSTSIVLNYLNFLIESFVTKKVNRFDIHGKRLFENNEKYYFQDIGLRNSLLTGGRAFDIEKVIENAVYNHLIFMGYNVTVGQLRNNREIDFIATRNNERCYIQVAYLLANEETIEREFGNLNSIKDNYPKYVISMSPLLENTGFNGIFNLSLRDFLKKTKL